MMYRKLIGAATSLALAFCMTAAHPLLSSAEDETPWTELAFGSAISQKVFDDSASGGMIEKSWDVGEAAVLGGIRPANGGGELSQKDAQIIFNNAAGIGQFKMTYVSTVEITGDTVFEFEMSADGVTYETVDPGAPVFVKNGFHSNPALSTYVEQCAFTSANVAAKGYKYLKIIRKGSADTAYFPLITEVFLGNGTGALSAVSLSSGVQMVSGGLKEQAWVQGDAGTLNGMRPDNDGVLNQEKAEVIFQTESAIGRAKIVFTGCTDIDNATAFLFSMSADGTVYEPVAATAPVILNDDVKLSGYVKQYEVSTADVAAKGYKYFKIVRPGSDLTAWYPAINAVSVQIPEIKDVVAYEPLTAEDGETIFTDQLDRDENEDQLGKMNNVSNLSFDTGVYKHREYMGLNYSNMHMTEGRKAGYAIYRADAMQRFKYTYISNESATSPELKAYISRDGVTFEDAEVTQTADPERTGDYKRYHVENDGALPAGIHYLKLEFTSEGTGNYETAVTMVSIAHKPESVQLTAGPDQALLFDNFEPPFALSLEKENMTNHPGTSGKLKIGQMYMRQEITGPSYIIYKANKIAAFEVDTNLDPTAELGDDFEILFYTSKTGEDGTWVEVASVTKRLGTTAGNIDWVDYLYSSDSLPPDSNYLKIEIPELELNNYDVNLCSVKILHSTKADDKPGGKDDKPGDKTEDEDGKKNPETGRPGIPAGLLILAVGAAALCWRKKTAVRG